MSNSHSLFEGSLPEDNISAFSSYLVLLPTRVEWLRERQALPSLIVDTFPYAYQSIETTDMSVGQTLRKFTGNI
jgi:hypothetical protein